MLVRILTECRGGIGRETECGGCRRLRRRYGSNPEDSLAFVGVAAALIRSAGAALHAEVARWRGQSVAGVSGSGRDNVSDNVSPSLAAPIRRTRSSARVRGRYVGSLPHPHTDRPSYRSPSPRTAATTDHPRTFRLRGGAKS